jgi:hypothetical protein
LTLGTHREGAEVAHPGAEVEHLAAGQQPVGVSQDEQPAVRISDHRADLDGVDSIAFNEVGFARPTQPAPWAAVSRPD